MTKKIAKGVHAVTTFNKHNTVSTLSLVEVQLVHSVMINKRTLSVLCMHILILSVYILLMNLHVQTSVAVESKCKKVPFLTEVIKKLV